MSRHPARASSRARSPIAWALIVCGLVYTGVWVALHWPSLALLPAFALVVPGAAILGSQSRHRQDAELPPQRRMDGSYEDTPREQGR
ncbi:hypothetical protein C8046_09175 [Serinibacter arcticus]|uniref:Uncharacterized protein n=1 Tax=Serinibacter arcticus TaxID=1655435 RepID=A0A2U1ZV45_9MICO|nr:hypothetical protein [Serinibacter arcticus]PWD50792.1 hypothetical protein C8046_09175 [Serinibacter arcticus]